MLNLREHIPDATLSKFLRAWERNVRNVSPNDRVMREYKKRLVPFQYPRPYQAHPARPD